MGEHSGSKRLIHSSLGKSLAAQMSSKTALAPGSPDPHRSGVSSAGMAGPSSLCLSSSLTPAPRVPETLLSVSWFLMELGGLSG